jgi:hypothetical protein
MSPVERAAKAAADRYLDIQDEHLPEPVAEAIARAVLQAIREPSDLMRSHGQWAISDNLTVSVCVENNLKAAEVWQAMIDTALSE